MVSLFTQVELTAAFALVLPSEKARELASEWFDVFADRTDPQGRYVHPESWGDSQPVEPPAAPLPDRPEWHSPEQIARDEALFTSWDDSVAREWLMRLGETHLALVALVSDELFERMRQARFMSNADAARNRLQLLRAVRAYRRRRGWAPAV